MSTIDCVEVPNERQEEFYTTGMEGAVSLNPSVALFVSLDESGVCRQRYGTVPSMLDRSEEYAAFADSEELRQSRLADELAESERYGAYVTGAAGDVGNAPRDRQLRR